MRLHCTHTHMHHLPIPSPKPPHSLHMKKIEARRPELIDAAREELGRIGVATIKGVVRRREMARACAGAGGEHGGRGVRWRAAAAAVNLPLASADGAAIPWTSSFWVVQAPFVCFRSFAVGRAQTIAGSGPRRPRPGDDDGGGRLVIERKVFRRFSALGWMRGRIYGSYAITFEVPP
jgi:hypothetical protein